MAWPTAVAVEAADMAAAAHHAMEMGSLASTKHLWVLILFISVLLLICFSDVNTSCTRKY